MNDTLSSESARNWAMWCHLSALSVLIGVPFGHLIIPGIIWVLKHEEDLFIDEHGKESLNFQLSLTIYVAISILLTVIWVGFIVLVLIPIFDVIFVVKAALQAKDGQSYRYPLTIRLFS